MQQKMQEERIAQLAGVQLLKGGHRDGSGQMCVMEAAAWVAGEPHSDHPKCVCPVLAGFLRKWNDGLDDATRQKLKVYIPRLLNTAHDGLQERRGWIAIDWLMRECAPAFLDAAGLASHATALRALAEICDRKSLQASAHASAHACGAASAAAWAAASAAAWDAARDAAWAAAWAAARDDSQERLASVVARVQESAFRLLDRMIDARSH